MRLPCLLVLATTVIASPAWTQQQQPPPPQAWRVVETQVAPSQIGAYRRNLTGLVEVAKAAKAPAAQRWFTYTTENRHLQARPVERNAILANLNAPIREAQPQSFQKWLDSLTPASTTQLVTLRNEIWVEAPDWSYVAPNAPAVPGGTSVAEVHIAPGRGAAFDSVRKDFVAFRKKIGYPYSVLALRVVIGEPRVVFVTFFDTREAFFGPNSLGTLVQKANAQAEWDAMIPRLVGPMAGEWKTSLWNYARNLSYDPTN
jgi:hypothetical protein